MVNEDQSGAPDLPFGNLPSAISAAPFVTADIPGTGGVIKQRPEDFLVEEIPAYPPRGEGEHIYLFIEKRNLATMNMVRLIAHHFDVPRRAVGVAGLKDRLAITRQVVSVHTPGRKPEDFPELDHPQLTVLWVDLHTNMLRRGHLRGNRFSIKIRGVDPSAVIRAHKVLKALKAGGVPNRFGEQRFGIHENNHIVGRALLRGDHDALLREVLGVSRLRPHVQREAREFYERGEYAEALEAFGPHAHVERSILRALIRGAAPKRAAWSFEAVSKLYYITAFQSALFNRVLDERIAAGSWDRLIPGDLAFKHDNGAVFAVDEDTAAEQETVQRAARLEISPSGPMWGSGMTAAAGEPGAMEARLLAKSDVTEADFARWKKHTGRSVPAERRPLRIPLTDPEVEGGVDEHGPYVRCAFELPRGAFATTVLREIIKPPPGERMDDAEEPAD